MITIMGETLEQVADEDVVDRVDSLVKSMVSTMDKILLRNKRGFEELYRKGIYVVGEKYNNSN